MLTTRVRSFQRGTLGLCRSKDCKVTTCQSWRMILSSGNRTRAAHVLFEVGRMAEFFSNLHLWQLVTLHPFGLQSPKSHFWKDLDLVVNIVSVNKTDSISKFGFVLSNWPYLHRANLVIVWRVLIKTINYQKGLSTYRARAIKGRSYYSKTIIWVLELWCVSLNLFQFYYKWVNEIFKSVPK